MNSVAEILMPGELVMNLELLSAYIHWAYVHVHLLVHIVSACEEINSLVGQVAGEGVVSQLTTSKVCAAIKGYKSASLIFGIFHFQEGNTKTPGTSNKRICSATERLSYRGSVFTM